MMLRKKREKILWQAVCFSPPLQNDDCCCQLYKYPSNVPVKGSIRSDENILLEFPAVEDRKGNLIPITVINDPAPKGA